MTSSTLRTGWWPRSSSPRGRARPRTSGAAAPLGRGVAMAYLSVVALIPLAAVVVRSFDNGTDGFWTAVSNPQAVAALKLTLVASLIVVVVNALFGTLIAWVLVRDEFPGKSVVNSLIDLPFALPTIVAGLTLLAFYGPDSPVGVNVAYTRVAVVMALLFVTLPFVRTAASRTGAPSPRPHACRPRSRRPGCRARRTRGGSGPRRSSGARTAGRSAS